MVEQRGEATLELGVGGRFDRRDDVVVELVESVELVVGQLVLALGGDAHDHDPASFLSPAVRWVGASPAPSWPLSLDSSSSTALSVVSWASCRSRYVASQDG